MTSNPLLTITAMTHLGISTDHPIIDIQVSDRAGSSISEKSLSIWLINNNNISDNKSIYSNDEDNDSNVNE